MIAILPFLSLVACQSGFDKDGSEINQTNEYGETVDADGNSLSTPNHDWDGDGYTENQGDCNDDDASIHPNATETYYDSIDSNCDGLSDFDKDQDGHVSDNWGGDDCDDNNPNIHPDQADDPTDGIDGDCDGQEDPRFIYYALDENFSQSIGAVALDVDQDKRVHVVFEDANELWYTNKSTPMGTWKTPIALGSNPSGDIAIGGEGQQLDGVMDNSYKFHIAYTEVDFSGNLSTRYIYLKNARAAVPEWIGSFEIEGMSSSGNTLSSHFLNIDMGTDQVPLFAYYDQASNRPILSKLNGVPASTQNAASFSFREEVDFVINDLTEGAPMGLNTALAVGASNMVYVAYLDETAPYGTGTDPATQVSALTNTNFYCESDLVAEPGGLAHALAVRPDNKLCIAYHDMVDHGLKYACQVQTSGCTDWDIQTIETDIGPTTSLAMGFNSQSIPYVAYHHTPTGTLRVASLGGTEWSIATAGAANGKDVGANVQLAIDGDNRVHVAYFNATDGSIWYGMGK